MHEFELVTPKVDVADDTVVSIALNGQQFIKDKTLYERDIENTFTYYDRPTVVDFHPEYGLAAGNTKIQINGKGFLPLKNDKGEFVRTPVYVRMKEMGTEKTIGEI